MKSQLFIKWFLSLFLISIVTVLILTTIFSRTTNVITEFLSRASAEIVVNQLSNLITVSSAAPNYIKIEYFPSENVVYDVSSKNRRLKVKPYYNTPLLENVEVERFYAIGLDDFEYKNVNRFVIEKSIENGKSKYVFHAYRS